MDGMEEQSLPPETDLETLLAFVVKVSYFSNDGWLAREALELLVRYGASSDDRSEP